MQSRYLAARKSAAQTVKIFKECSWNPTIYWQTKYFGTPSADCGKRLSTTTSIKDSTGNILRDEKKILLLWRKYFEDLLNPVRATPTYTFDTIEFEKEEVYTSTEVAAAIRGLKSRKAAGEDKIRPEILKALNEEGVRWLTRMCQVAWKLRKTPKNWQTGVIILIYKKGDCKKQVRKT